MTVWHQRRLERDKALNARADAVVKELAAAVQQLTISVASALHSMCWLTWLADTRPDQLTQARIDKYDDEQHINLPRILGFLGTTAALDLDLYQQLRVHVDEVFRLDAEIGRAGLEFKDAPDAAATQLGSYNQQTTQFEKRLPLLLGDIIGGRMRSPQSNATEASS
jgi:hypothetical protein